jgi:hypothetical protein
MKRWIGYGLLGLFAYLVFMLIQFPATVLFDWITQRVPELSVRDMHGSARQGSARGVRLRGVQFESLSWQLQFFPLLLGRLEYQFNLAEPGSRLQGKIATSFDRQLSLGDVKGSLPLTKLSALTERPSLPLDGQVELDIAGLQLNTLGRLRSVFGTIRLLSARTTLAKPLELGNFNVELSTQDQDILGNIKDSGGPLEFTGNLTLTQDGSYRFSGQAAVRDENNRELRQALSLLGRPGGNGKWKINLAGTL